MQKPNTKEAPVRFLTTFKGTPENARELPRPICWKNISNSAPWISGTPTSHPAPRSGGAAARVLSKHKRSWRAAGSAARPRQLPALAGTPRLTPTQGESSGRELGERERGRVCWETLGACPRVRRSRLKFAKPFPSPSGYGPHFWQQFLHNNHLMYLVTSAFRHGYQLAFFPVPKHFTAKCSKSYSALIPSLKKMPGLPVTGSYKRDGSLPPRNHCP